MTGAIELAPGMTNETAANYFTAPAGDLLQAIENIMLWSAPEDDRPQWTSVNFAVSAKAGRVTLQAVADPYHAAWETVNAVAVGEFSFMVQRRALVVFSKSWPRRKRGTVPVSVSLAATAGLVTFEQEGGYAPLRAVFPVTEGTFPDLDTVTPHGAPVSVTTITLNPHFMALLAKVVTAEESVFHWTFYGPLAPVVIRSGMFHLLVMPIRTVPTAWSLTHDPIEKEGETKMKDSVATTRRAGLSRAESAPVEQP